MLMPSGGVYGGCRRTGRTFECVPTNHTREVLAELHYSCNFVLSSGTVGISGLGTLVPARRKVPPRSRPCDRRGHGGAVSGEEPGPCGFEGCFGRSAAAWRAGRPPSAPRSLRGRSAALTGRTAPTDGAQNPGSRSFRSAAARAAGAYLAPGIPSSWRAARRTTWSACSGRSSSSNARAPADRDKTLRPRRAQRPPPPVINISAPLILHHCSSAPPPELQQISTGTPPDLQRCPARTRPGPEGPGVCVSFGGLCSE